jgi:hypothetical protein
MSDAAIATAPSAITFFLSISSPLESLKIQG